jgi:hypothetical protein
MCLTSINNLYLLYYFQLWPWSVSQIEGVHSVDLCSIVMELRKNSLSLSLSLSLC